MLINKISFSIYFACCCFVLNVNANISISATKYNSAPQWGFHGHRLINEMAIYTLPPELMRFYKIHQQSIVALAVKADQRRYAVIGEAPRHYLDLEAYPDTLLQAPFLTGQEAKLLYGENFLNEHGSLPWTIMDFCYLLQKAFEVRDFDRVIRLSADLGHYVGDAHVPLHTTENYNGQLTDQLGIHALWESRLPELFSSHYDFWLGRAEYCTDVKTQVWQTIAHSHALVFEVLALEKTSREKYGGDKYYGFEQRGQQNVRVVSQAFSEHYHQQLDGMVERQMQQSVIMLGSLWLTAWVNAGQPDLTDDRVQVKEEQPEKDAKVKPSRLHE